MKTPHHSFTLLALMFVLISTLATGCGSGSDSGSGSGGGSATGGDTGSTIEHIKVAPQGVFVVNKGDLWKLNSDSLSRIDASTNTVVKTLQTDNAPAINQIYPTPDSAIYCNNSIWVGSYGYSTMSQIDPNYNEAPARVSKFDTDSGMTCVGNQIWAVSSATTSAKIYDTVKGTITTLSLGAPGTGAYATWNGVWVGDMSGTFTQYDSTTLKVLGSANINSGGMSYIALGVTGGSDHLWVVAKNMLSNKIALIKIDSVLKKKTFEADLDIAGLSDTNIALGGRLDILEVLGKVWFPAAPINSMVVVSASTGKVLTQIPVGQAPVGVAYGFNSIWVANSKDGTVSKINTTTSKVTNTITVGMNPVRIAVSP